MASCLHITRLLAQACTCVAMCGVFHLIHAQNAGQVAKEPREQVLITPQPQYSSAGADIPMIYNSEGFWIASQGRARHFGSKVINRRLLDTYKLYAMRNRRTTGRPRASNLPSKFGKSMFEIGISRNLKFDWTLTTKITPINKRLQTGEGIIDIPKIYAKAAADASQYTYLESLINTENSSWPMRHPAIHPSGMMVVWSATRQDGNKIHDVDGTGGADLWYSIKAHGSWQFPQKFSPRVNSTANEIFPTFNTDGTILFWSSNRHDGLGGYDLFQAKILLPSKFDRPGDTLYYERAVPMPQPLNTLGDDLAIVWRSDLGSHDQYGYLAQTKHAGDIDADIFAFKFEFPTCTGTIVAASDHILLPGARANFVNPQGDTITSEADQQGNFKVGLEFNKVYSYSATAPGYLVSERHYVSTIGLAQGAGIQMDTVLLTRFEFPENVIVGTVKSLTGQSLLPEVAIEFYSDDPRLAPPAMEKYDDHFLLHASRAVDFYIDVSTPLPTASTFHFVPDMYLATDTVHADMILDDSTIQLKRIIVAYEGTPNVPGIPVAKLLLFKKGQAMPQELGYDIGIDLQSLRIGTPMEHTKRCSVVVAQVDCIPVVIDPRNGDCPDTIKLIPKSLRYEKPIVIYHRFNEREPDYEISATDLEGISLFLIQDTTAKIKVTAHTDCRGTASYNLALSKRRAEMVKAFILTRTNPAFATRISTEGKGEGAPAIPCDCELGCPEIVHSENRRTEILLLRPGINPQYVSGVNQ